MRDFSLPKDLQLAVESISRPPAYPNRYYTCAVCGQTVDRISLEQVYHHGPQPHQPLQKFGDRRSE